jgi:hypothetical protein
MKKRHMAHGEGLGTRPLKFAMSRSLRAWKASVKKQIVAIGLLLTLPLGSADAMFRYCSQPIAPSVGFITKPSKPFCAAARNCSEWEVSAYRSDVESYYRKLKRYAEEVETYYADAATYLKCMADLD